MSDDIVERMASNVPRPRVHVKGGDYAYEGWCISLFFKRSGASRCVVEDDNGRLFIHNLEQVTFL